MHFSSKSQNAQRVYQMHHSDLDSGGQKNSLHTPKSCVGGILLDYCENTGKVQIFRDLPH